MKLRACAANDLPEGEMLWIEHDPPLALYHSEGEFFATQGFCSHEDAPLTEGWLENQQIECPWHGTRFCLRTGAALSPPAYEPVRTYPVTVEDGVVFVDLGKDAAGD